MGVAAVYREQQAIPAVVVTVEVDVAVKVYESTNGAGRKSDPRGTLSADMSGGHVRA